MRRLVLAAVLPPAMILPTAAQADVLVTAVPPRLVCGDSIQVGVFGQVGTRGDRTVRILAVDGRTGVVFWRRTASARIGRWRYWSLPSGRRGQCGPTTIVYRGKRPDGSAWSGRFRVLFRSEGV
jgi:hypothetical protein